MNDEPLKDCKESSINVFHYGARNEPCTFHTSVESIKNQMLRRNPNCTLICDGPEWILEYPRSQVRQPWQWIKVAGEPDEEPESDLELDSVGDK
tara:strand:+ start:976 stop:1257 length:282 start_codon:yes stop_codon:yes gene_type:complete